MEKKIYPTPQELLKVNTSVPCTEKSCNNIFTSESNLHLHLIKTHKKQDIWSQDTSKREYYCPDTNCIYNETKHFKSMKLLKQHYVKVHAEKNFICASCGKGFATQTTLNAHVEYCGITFKCCDCESSYPLYESLVTHARRKKHKVLEKVEYKGGFIIPVKKSNSQQTLPIKKNAFILPKGSMSLQLISLNKIPVFTSEKCNQTEQIDWFKMQNVDNVQIDDKLQSINKMQTEDEIKSLNKIQTVNKFQSEYKIHFEDKIHNENKILFENDQTDNKIQTEDKIQILINTSSQTNYLRPQSSMETQTVGDYFTKKANVNLITFSDENLNKKSIKTQTKRVSSSTKSCNTSFNIDFEIAEDIKVERNSSSTQTVTSIPAEFIYSTPMETQKDFDMDTLDTESFFNCNMETQTDFIFGNDLLNSDYYSNMYTQTCDDILLNELGFNSSQTQTVLEDMLRSVESQTMMSHNSKNFMTCRDMAHMETQTDAEYKQMLEEINA